MLRLRILTLLFSLLFFNGCTAWPALTAALALVGGGSSGGALLIPPPSGNAGSPGASSPQEETPSPEEDLGELVSIRIQTQDPQVPIGIDLDLRVEGTYSGGSTAFITESITWSSQDTGIATISNQGDIGRVRGVSLGTTTIQASHQGLTASTELTVTSAVLVSLAITPSDLQIPVGSNRFFNAEGTFSDGSNVDLTDQVTWSSGSTSVATVQNAPNYGRFDALTQGTTTITATHPGTNVTASETAVVLADTTNPVVVSASSLSPTQIQVTFSKPMESDNPSDTNSATNPANYKVVRSSSVSGNCTDNSNFSDSTQTGDFSLASVSGSGTDFTLTLGATEEQTSGVNYTLIANKANLRDTASPANALGCDNFASFEGQARLRVNTASSLSLTRILVTFSKPVLSGTATGGAECTNSIQCEGKYRLTGSSDLGDITSASIPNGTNCGGIPANSAQVCITHSLLQGGGVYTIIAANGISGDGFNDAGAIRDFGNTENLQSAPRDRVNFTGGGVIPNNFVEGAISEDTFGDGTSFGYLTRYNDQIYIGPNSKGNSASRFNFDGTGIANLGFTIEKDTGNNNGGRNNTASTRDGGIAVPPFVTMGHAGCSVNSADIQTGCGPGNENGRGVFARATFFGKDYLFLGGARNYTGNWSYNYIYYTENTGTTLNFKWIRLGSMTGSSTEGSQSFATNGNRLYAGFAKTNHPNNCNDLTPVPISCSRNTPDFGFIPFSEDGSGSTCQLGENCDAQANGAVRIRIDAVDYFGGSNANTASGIATDNWGKYTGVDSIFVFRNRIYAANGGHHKIGRDGGIIHSVTDTPGACDFGSDECDSQWIEIAPRDHSMWNNKDAPASDRWFSLELRKAFDFSPMDKAFASFAEFHGNLYAIRTVCKTAESTATTHAQAFETGAVAGCTDGSYGNRRPQLWKCVPGTTGDSETCEAGDWSLVGHGGTGFSNMGVIGNHSATLLVVNGGYLYMGFDNEAGVQIWRTNHTNPDSDPSLWEKIGEDGLGDTNMRNIFSGLSAPVGSQNFIYVATGRNGTPLKIFRQQNN